MQRIAASAVVALLTACSIQPIFAQTTVNPDISVIPRLHIESNDGEKLSEGRREFSRPDIVFEELELAFQAYLNPFARGDVILTVPGPDIEKSKVGVEEVYASVLRGLPLDLNVRFGKYRVEYGKLNMVHPHAWPFVTEPLSQERFLGEDGLNDVGVSVSVLLPTGDVYSKLTIDMLRGGAIGDAAGIPDTSGNRPYFSNSARLSGFFTLSDYSDLEIGVSGLTGIHDPYNRERFWYANGDFKYKYRPSSYTSLVVQGEYLFNTRGASQDRTFHQFVDSHGAPQRLTINTSGCYIYGDYQFFKMYSIGARYDWSESPYSKDDRAHAIALFLGYYPVEETLGLRLQVQNTNTELPGVSRSVNSIILQALFSLGPHKAHPF
jgi:hypothetical protein